MDLVDDLAQLQSRIRHTGEQLDDPDYRSQYHTDLSPLGWHVGHCTFIETYWLREIALGENSVTADLHGLYVPENIPKPQRGPALPEQSEHLQWCETLNRENRELLASPPAKLRQHTLSKNDYLGKFILQHHAQHFETIHMVLQQRALDKGAPGFLANVPLEPRMPEYASSALAAGRYPVGSDRRPEAYDNELPAHEVELEDTRIATSPVSNAEWLAFMQDGGYDTAAYWSEQGWQWRQESAAHAPEHWRQDQQGHWFGLDHTGAHCLEQDQAVYGINYYEADAFARWLNARHAMKARLPHEHEWEAAAGNGLLENSYEVWEWCANTFHPYKGFTPFPYDGYSKSWFDDNHYVLRGGSKLTCDVIRRHSFRNFYNPDKRHIFAGLRLAFDW